ncbi:MAG TPA: S8 family serine peptidase, partial [Tissierellaceae bacterium]|nr:S8 family serine peptidase [Tissierellaceae bacterium]
MKKFNSLNELNDYVNSNPIDINDIDIDSLTVKITSKMTTFGVMSTEKEYPCYIVFNDKSSYREYKEGKQIDADLHSINAIQINITLSEFKRLKPNVRFIEFIDINEKATLAEANNESYEPVKTNWGADIANVQESWAKGYTGKGVKVAAVDVGFVSNPNFLNFKEHVIFAEARDKSHGTACASVICSPPSSKYLTGIAHGCDMYALETNLLTTAIMQACQWCIDNEMDIITMSIVWNSNFEWGPYDTSKLLWEEVVARGIIFVAGAGNRNVYPLTYPAFVDGVIAVSAIAHVRGKLTKVSWDNTTSEGGGLNQPWLDFIFAGTNVKVASIYNTGRTANGTSVSAPAIAGMFALLKEEFPNKTR